MAVSVGGDLLLAASPQAGTRPEADRSLRPAPRPTECDRQPDPLGWLLAKERCGQVRLAMTRVPKRDAELLMLKYTEDWSYRQLADHLGVSESAVEARLHRARQRLRTELTAIDLAGVEG